MLLAYAFSNGGQLRTNEKVYINNEPLIETPHYKYFDIMFSSRLCRSTALRTLLYQADKATYTITFINPECNG